MSAPAPDRGDRIDRGPAIVRAWAPWCHNCRAMAPVVEAVAAARDGDRAVPVIDVRVDEEPDLVDRFAIRSVPTLVAVHDGVEVGRLVGGQSKAAIQRLFDAASIPAQGSGVPGSAPLAVTVRPGLPWYLLGGRLGAGVVLAATGVGLDRSVLVVLGAIMVAWALWGAIRR